MITTNANIEKQLEIKHHRKVESAGSFPNITNVSYKFFRFWKILGPGLVTGSSDDDPSGIATYSQAGAAYGLSTLWTALVTFPLMAAIQEMCARIGLVTSQGLAGTIRAHYSLPVLYLMLLFSFPAIVMNIGADIAGMGAVGNLFSLPYTRPISVCSSPSYFSCQSYTCRIAKSPPS